MRYEVKTSYFNYYLLDSVINLAPEFRNLLKVFITVGGIKYEV